MVLSLSSIPEDYCVLPGNEVVIDIGPLDAKPSDSDPITQDLCMALRCQNAEAARMILWRHTRSRWDISAAFYNTDQIRAVFHFSRRIQTHHAPGTFFLHRKATQLLIAHSFTRPCACFFRQIQKSFPRKCFARSVYPAFETFAGEDHSRNEIARALDWSRPFMTEEQVAHHREPPTPEESSDSDEEGPPICCTIS